MVSAFIAVRYYDIDQLITVDRLIENKDRLIAFAGRHHLASVLIFCSAYISLVAVGLPVFMVFSIAAGLIFGFLEGLSLCVLSASIGGYITFLVSRTVLHDFFRNRHIKRVEQLEKRLEGKSLRVLLVMRLIPGVPYTLTNILTGLTEVDWLTFGIATIVGIIPGTSVFIFSGYALREVDTFNAFKQPQFITALVLFTLVLILAIIRKIYKSKR